MTPEMIGAQDSTKDATVHLNNNPAYQGYVDDIKKKEA